MKIIVFGGDGFCGWPTSLRLLRNNHEVLIVDNLSRRKIDNDLETNSLTNILPIEERISLANEVLKPNKKLIFNNIDIAKDVEELNNIMASFKPDAIIQFAEQRAAPYSMIDDDTRRYTVDNNISGTHNICSSIVKNKLDCHLVHLGTMGVYGYNKDFGVIPEGYLDINIKQTNRDTEILYPANPGSVYHMTKCLDQLIFQFYTKNWGLKVTDLHQGIVWGVNTNETALHEGLVNRFDYDGIYGTVLNRFIVQAANNYPITVYGSGGQSRAFIHINDTAECLKIAVENPPNSSEKVRIMNQVSEVRNVKELAQIVSELYNSEVQYVENPRKELAENDLEVLNDNFLNLGFKPTLLETGLISDVESIAKSLKENFDPNVVLNSPRW